MTKSFTSAAIGIAIAQGKISGVDENVLAFFDDDMVIDNLDERKQRMTLEDLLTMRSGTDYHERGSNSPHWQLNSKRRGWTQFVLDRPMVTEPRHALSVRQRRRHSGLGAHQGTLRCARGTYY